MCIPWRSHFEIKDDIIPCSLAKLTELIYIYISSHPLYIRPYRWLTCRPMGEFLPVLPSPPSGGRTCTISTIYTQTGEASCPAPRLRTLGLSTHLTLISLVPHLLCLFSTFSYFLLDRLLFLTPCSRASYAFINLFPCHLSSNLFPHLPTSPATSAVIYSHLAPHTTKV